MASTGLRKVLHLVLVAAALRGALGNIFSPAHSTGARPGRARPSPRRDHRLEQLTRRSARAGGRGKPAPAAERTTLLRDLVRCDRSRQGRRSRISALYLDLGRHGRGGLASCGTLADAIEAFRGKRQAGSSPTAISGYACRQLPATATATQLPATSYQLPATSYQLPGYQLPATSYQLPATSYQLPSYQLPATSYQLPATSYQLPATSYQLPPRERQRNPWRASTTSARVPRCCPRRSSHGRGGDARLAPEWHVGHGR